MIIININIYESRVRKRTHLTSTSKLNSNHYTKSIKSTDRSTIAIQYKFCSSKTLHNDLDDDFLPLFSFLSFWKVLGMLIRFNPQLDNLSEWTHQLKWNLLPNCHYYCSIVYLDKYNFSWCRLHMEGQKSEGTFLNSNLLFHQRLLLGTSVIYQEYWKIPISAQYPLGCTLVTIFYCTLWNNSWFFL